MLLIDTQVGSIAAGLEVGGGASAWTAVQRTGAQVTQSSGIRREIRQGQARVWHATHCPMSSALMLVTTAVRSTGTGITAFLKQALMASSLSLAGVGTHPRLPALGHCT